MRHGSAAGHEDDEGAFAADEVDQQLEEGVNGECLELSAQLPSVVTK